MARKNATSYHVPSLKQFVLSAQYWDCAVPCATERHAGGDGRSSVPSRTKGPLNFYDAIYFDVPTAGENQCASRGLERTLLRVSAQSDLPFRLSCPAAIRGDTASSKTAHPAV